jgi:dihydrolipoamide dehydrogenase
MAVAAVETVAGAETQGIDFSMVPRATWCRPRIAAFGYTEAQDRAAVFAVTVAKFPFSQRQGIRPGPRVGLRQADRRH